MTSQCCPGADVIEIDGVSANDCTKATKEQRAKLRSTVQIVFQDPYSSLDRTESVGTALREVLAVNGFPRDQAAARIDKLLDRVGLPRGYAKRRPAALSGGERQRVTIARTLAVNPKLLVCDEPVSALDVSVQAQPPAGRWGEAANVAGATVFLASPASDYVCGVIVPVDGGWLAR